MPLLCLFAQPKKPHFTCVKIFIHNKDILALGIIKNSERFFIFIGKFCLKVLYNIIRLLIRIKLDRGDKILRVPEKLVVSNQVGESKTYEILNMV